MQDQEVIGEFLVESHENLSRLDSELVELEKRPKDASLLASIFRTIHTIKGTCGFLAFTTLEKITHQAESLLSQLRDGERELTPQLVSLVLETVDATRKVLASIEASGEEGPDHFDDLTARLRAAAQLTSDPEVVPQALVIAESATVEPTPFGNPGWPATSPVEPAIAELDLSPVTSVHSEAVADVPETKRPEEDLAKNSAVADSNIRVGVGLLDNLMDLVGELVLTRNQILQFNADREDPALNATAQRLNLITTELQAGVMKTRMQPIGMIWNKLPRVVRDISVALGKQIRLEMDGAETELDRTIIEAIKDPLVHLVRNSCDHGIEAPDVRTWAGKAPQGTLSLRAYHEGGQVIIEIGDDGAGIDVARVKQKAIDKGILRPEQAEKLSEREALNLIFQPGFSTAQTITNVSGRGVGMDVVKSHIEKIGGVVDLFSRHGEGATVKLKIPLTLAIIPGLVVTSGGERFVIPQVSLLELIRLEGDSTEKRIERVHGTPVYRRRGSLLPVAYLNEVLGLPDSPQSDAVSMVVLQAEDRQFGLVVDEINDTQEIVVKPLGKQMKGLTIYAGATIMGDGRVALILDVLGIGQQSGALSGSVEPARAKVELNAQSGPERQRLLLFQSGSFDRLAVPLSLVARLEEIPRRSIEHSGGRQVFQYRQGILPLTNLRGFLEPGTEAATEADLLRVLVFRDSAAGNAGDGGRSVGLIVDQILDVTEVTVTVRQKTRRKGLLGSGVVDGQVTDFLDLEEVLRYANEDWLDSSPGHGKCVLLAEASAFTRGLIRNSLDMAGYQVLEARNQEEVVRRLEQYRVDVVVTAFDFPPLGSAELLAVLRGRPEWENIPVLALADNDTQLAQSTQGFQDCLLKSDRQAMLDSVARLSQALAGEEPTLALAGTGREI